MKIRPVGAELFHADVRADEPYDEANSRFSDRETRTAYSVQELDD
jgi:hypothetical protein